MRMQRNALLLALPLDASPPGRWVSRACRRSRSRYASTQTKIVKGRLGWIMAKRCANKVTDVVDPRLRRRTASTRTARGRTQPAVRVPSSGLKTISREAKSPPLPKSAVTSAEASDALRSLASARCLVTCHRSSHDPPCANKVDGALARAHCVCIAWGDVHNVLAGCGLFALGDQGESTTSALCTHRPNTKVPNTKVRTRAPFRHLEGSDS